MDSDFDMWILNLIGATSFSRRFQRAGCVSGAGLGL